MIIGGCVDIDYLYLILFVLVVVFTLIMKRIDNPDQYENYRPNKNRELANEREVDNG